MNSKNNLLKLEEIGLHLNEGEDILNSKIAEILQIPETEILSYKITKKAIDSRKKTDILFVYSVEVSVKNPENIKEFNVRHRVRFFEPFVYEIKKAKKKPANRPVIIGSGPCGLFSALLLAKAGLNPLVIERGASVDDRVKTVNKFFKEGVLNKESNVQFGEGGAGTFSDGKLYTLVNDPRSKFVFEELVKAGAPEEILFSATPHVGTDLLREVVKKLREEIISLGGEFRFSSCLTDLIIQKGKLSGIIVNGTEEIKVTDLILAIGHSARDTYQLLFDRQVELAAKPFSIGVRIEHKAEMINRSQYGNSFKDEKLGVAKYKLVESQTGVRSVYTFCMCPGGYVMAAASEEGMVVTNGMSEFAQDGVNSNSALLVPVTPEDFGSDHPLAGIEFQRYWEKRAFQAGGGNYLAPAQLVGDFLAGKPSKKVMRMAATYPRGVSFCSLDMCLPDFVLESLRKALPLMERKIKGFAHPEAVLTGVETRSSAPVRIIRGENRESKISGLYPAGEGAGYAGGIVSSAIDGLATAEIIIEKYL
ncbi:MAG: NAD(P)/FAD-dependent oxidoreductase [Patescibacteria group bacterium]